ncbi:hypothetical protein [Aquimonas sp.]|jgi:hypothetical protein|uniref:hypothetical protein n=1 Tax=Aquimonas sp. TaxID=1872588 RepID=UPI0037BF518E
MSKILQIAWREFVATAMTKGFIIGLVAMLAVPLLSNFKSPAVHALAADADVEAEKA